ncbi:MAG: hypothetical protein A3H79_00835 [Candidatus Levybacteria bacterium RIFCSPLOWO2_02_FULL_36_8b]|nr:MAG: hypothetical protein A3H79_00835 [Candidatus Levybacteria bacterium RIFCSPLOWO2_02_FULL_36_8b]
MKKIVFLSSLIICTSVFAISGSLANAKLLPQAKGSTSNAKTKVINNSKSISVFPKLRKDRKALIVSFGNLGSSRSVGYSLIYQTQDHQEGAGGSINMQTESGGATRELLFGTCSKTVCRYHTNISNMRLEVTSELKSGRKTLKRYRIKV